MACADEAHVVGVDVGSPALHEIPTTSVVSSSGQARKSCEGGHLSHEEGSLYSDGTATGRLFILFHSTGRRARRREARLVETQHGGGSRRDEARHQPEPRPDGGGAKPGGASSASRRPQPPPSNFTQPSNLIIRQHYRSQVDFKLSEPIEGACWKVKYTVDITEMKFVVEVRPRTTRPSPLEVSTDPAGVPSACFHSRVLRE